MSEVKTPWKDYVGDELKERVKKLEFELEQELAWRNRTDEEQV